MSLDWAVMCGSYFLHQVAAVALIVIGVVMYSSYNTYSEITSADHILAPATIVIAVGIFLLLLGIVGCVGAFKEQKCLLGIVSYSLVLWKTTSIGSLRRVYYVANDRPKHRSGEVKLINSNRTTCLRSNQHCKSSSQITSSTIAEHYRM